MASRAIIHGNYDGGRHVSLYLDVAVERSQLLAERHKFAAGDAAAQDVREVGGDGRDLGDLVYLAHPFDGVERVVEEVRIQLGLQVAFIGQSGYGFGGLCPESR